MKKFIIFILIGIIFIFNISDTYAEDKLKVDSDSLKNSGNEAYVSVTDLYGIPLFTEKVIKQKEENQTNERNNFQKLNDDVFQKTSIEEVSKDEQFLKIINGYNLFGKPKSEIKIKYEEEKISESLIEVAIAIILLCILTAILTRKYYKHNSKKEADNSEYKDYIGF